MSSPVHDDLSDEELDRQAGLFGPLGQTVRELVDAAIRSEVDDDEVRAITAELSALVERLRAKQLPGSYGIHYSPSGRSRAWGNAAIGLRNGIAPPLTVVREEPGVVWSEFHLGAAYEGPPGLVHGGMCAHVLDHVMGECASSSGRPGFTGTLTMRYLAGTPLGDLRVDARVDRVEGVKTIVTGVLRSGDVDCVAAEGIFIVPRERRGEPMTDLLANAVRQ